MSDNKIIPQLSEAQNLKDTNAAFGGDNDAQYKSNGLNDSKTSETAPFVKDASEKRAEQAIEKQADQITRKFKKKPPQFDYFNRKNKNMSDRAESFIRKLEAQNLQDSKRFGYDTVGKPQETCI